MFAAKLAFCTNTARITHTHTHRCNAVFSPLHLSLSPFLFCYLLSFSVHPAGIQSRTVHCNVCTHLDPINIRRCKRARGAHIKLYEQIRSIAAICVCIWYECAVHALNARKRSNAERAQCAALETLCARSVRRNRGVRSIRSRCTAETYAL